MDVAEPDGRFQRCDPDDPHRCSGVGKSSSSGQCVFLAQRLPDGKFGKHCALHGASIEAKSFKKEARRLYDVQKYRGKIDRLVDAGEGIYLTEELAVLRMTLETCLDKYEAVELITMSGQVSHLIGQIRETLVADTKLKSKMGALLDRSAVDKLCDAIVEIMGSELPPEAMDRVSSRVAAAVADAVASRADSTF